MPYGAGRVRVYVGMTSGTQIAAKVLECSIVRRTEMQVDIVHMQGREWEYETAGLPKGCDEYNLRRWMIPAHAQFSGMALYIDAASLVTSDIWDLWTIPCQTATRGLRTVFCPHAQFDPVRRGGQHYAEPFDKRRKDFAIYLRDAVDLIL